MSGSYSSSNHPHGEVARTDGSAIRRHKKKSLRHLGRARVCMCACIRMLLGRIICCKLPLMWDLRGGQCARDLIGTPSPKSIGTLGHWKVEAPGCTSKLLGFVGHRTSWWWGVYGTGSYVTVKIRSGAYLCRIGSFKNVLCCVSVHVLLPHYPISLRSRSTACHRKRRSPP